MSHFDIQQLDPLKLPLVQKMYKAHYPSGKAKSSELIYVCYETNKLAGVVRIRAIDSWRLLTGMLVDPAFRGSGIGHALMDHCQANALTHNDYCFAYKHLEHFYSQHGFLTIDSEELPAQLRSLFERYSRSGKSLVPMKYQFEKNI